MEIEGLDHLVLTVKSIEVSCDFYRRVLGAEIVTFGENRKAISIGAQKINLQQQGQEIEPKAEHPTPGAGDFCLLSAMPLTEVAAHLASCGVAITQGPVERTGARGPLVSLYFRDPDLNLIEVSNLK